MHEREQPRNERIPSGLPLLDDLIDGFRLGDNVLWQVERLDDYQHFALAFADQSIHDQRPLIYIRFGTHPPLLEQAPGLVIESFDARMGFDVFSAQVHRIITHWGKQAFYVFDSLSCLVDLWATDELLASFFQATCPYLYELDTVAYFALDRDKHADSALARVRDTTQVLLDTFRLDTALHVRPLKVFERHSPHMFLPHRIEKEAWIPIPEREVPKSDLAYETKAPWDTVYAELQALLASDPAEQAAEQIESLRVQLMRMLLGSDETILRLADEFLPLSTLMHIRGRVVGAGRIGGKAAGMVLARAIVRTTCANVASAFPLVAEDAFYIGSDVFYTFLVHNNLFRDRLSVTRKGQISREGFVALEGRFLDGGFDDDRMDAFRALLDELGGEPYIVRSSSLLEDGFGNAFAGKYRSEFCVNRGTADERLEELVLAIKCVYASTLNPDALSYRRNRGMLENDEQMAILIHRVDGGQHGRYFFPVLAGVAFSRNLYAWTERIDPRKGVIRLVFGLGTRAVNRVSSDYPRMIAVSHPELRPEIGEEVIAYSQREVDALDLKAGTFATVRMDEIHKEGIHPRLHLLVSLEEDGYLRDPIGRRIQSPDRSVLTFNRLLKETDFVSLMGRMLSALEQVYAQPVDTEFAATITDDGRIEINILQCRPMWLPGSTERVVIPDDLKDAQVLFRSDRFINGGVVEPIRYILYVDPRNYAHSADEHMRKALPRVIGQINEQVQADGERIMMMGPGRWGTSNPELGIGVGYADIDQVSVLVEVALEDEGHVPEVSYGTHFFQDLVEAEIVYMPVYPSQRAVSFNETFFREAPNVLTEWLPSLASYASIIKVIDVPAYRNGAHVALVADPESRRAVCYLT